MKSFGKNYALNIFFSLFLEETLYQYKSGLNV